LAWKIKAVKVKAVTYRKPKNARSKREDQSVREQIGAKDAPNKQQNNTDANTRRKEEPTGNHVTDGAIVGVPLNVLHDQRALLG
jgi:hypothetical protein